MSSWVRYSVAVYAGLMLAGVLVGPVPQPSHGSFYIPGLVEPIDEEQHIEPAPTPRIHPPQPQPPRVQKPEHEPGPSGTLTP